MSPYHDDLNAALNRIKTLEAENAELRATLNDEGKPFEDRSMYCPEKDKDNMFTLMNDEIAAGIKKQNNKNTNDSIYEMIKEEITEQLVKNDFDEKAARIKVSRETNIADQCDMFNLRVTCPECDILVGKMLSHSQMIGGDPEAAVADMAASLVKKVTTRINEARRDIIAGDVK